jgi:ABC-type multidrug transport system fused ATPase/permease subunit
MFRFLTPVKPLAFLAILPAAGVGMEQLTVLQTGKVVDHISNHLARMKRCGILDWFAGRRRAPTLWRSLLHHDSNLPLRDLLLVLVALTSVMLLLRYLRIVAESKLSMTLVFYIREAVYDKLQRVGFGFHDAISTGQLINRALTDLNNVRTFVQQGLLLSLEIVLVVARYIVVIYSRILARARRSAAADLDLVHPPLQQEGSAANKLVMEAGDRDVSIITENIAACT